MPCLKSVEKIWLHQHILLLHCLAELSVLAEHVVELQQVSSQHLRVLLQISLLLVLCFNLIWWGWRGHQSTTADRSVQVVHRHSMCKPLYIVTLYIAYCYFSTLRLYMYVCVDVYFNISSFKTSEFPQHGITKVIIVSVFQSFCCEIHVLS